MDVYYSSIEFIEQLKRKHKEYMKPEIISVSMIQDEENVYLEIAESEILDDGLEKISVKRTNLDFIADTNDDQTSISLFFDPDDSVESNVRKFLNDYDVYSIVMTTDLFTKDACDLICRNQKLGSLNS